MKAAVGLLAIRLVFGFRLIYGTIDNIISWDQMLEFEAFLAANNFPLPLVSAVLSVYLQFLAGISWITGFYVRISSILMIGNFLVAIFGVHVMNGHSYLNTAPAIHLLSISILLFLTGAGKYAINNK